MELSIYIYYSVKAIYSFLIVLRFLYFNNVKVYIKFLIASKQIYSQSFEKYWSRVGASHFKDAGVGAIDFLPAPQP